MFPMAEPRLEFIEIGKLRVGMFIQLDLGWMSHPFPANSFKITSEKQLETIRALGLSHVHVNLDKSDPESSMAPSPSSDSAAILTHAAMPDPLTDEAQDATTRVWRRERLAAQRASFAHCEVLFAQATTDCARIMGCVGAQPEAARQQSELLVNAMVDQLMSEGESMIHLLSDGSGDRAALHPVNVTVLSLLLGKSLDLATDAMRELGVAALLHDVGKAQLPERVRWRDPGFTAMEDKVHQEHVGLGVGVARRMGLSVQVQQCIGQHHEMVDGSGFPAGLKGEDMTPSARLLALVNRYDNLCNPFNPNQALTPHEALALIFAQTKTRFDSASLSAFIRLMGVYPPGSVVQLSDERYALVMSVNSARPLRPQVIVHDPHIPRDEALILNLENEPQLGIRRSLKPMHLPQAALSYLSPRKRISYFFEQTPSPDGI